MNEWGMNEWTSAEGDRNHEWIHVIHSCNMNDKETMSPLPVRGMPRPAPIVLGNTTNEGPITVGGPSAPTGRIIHVMLGEELPLGHKGQPSAPPEPTPTWTSASVS